MSHAPPAVRRLGAADVPAMRRLNALFAEAFADQPSYAGAPPPDATLAARLAEPGIVVLVAERDEALVGGLVAYELPKLEQARSELYIYDLAVAEPARRQGIATALIAALRRHARLCGAWVIFVQADHGDPPAIALYDKLGVREHVLHFDIEP